jgi:hypothetical protein
LDGQKEPSAVVGVRCSLAISSLHGWLDRVAGGHSPARPRVETIAAVTGSRQPLTQPSFAVEQLPRPDAGRRLATRVGVWGEEVDRASTAVSAAAAASRPQAMMITHLCLMARK